MKTKAFIISIILIFFNTVNISFAQEPKDNTELALKAISCGEELFLNEPQINLHKIFTFLPAQKTIIEMKYKLNQAFDNFFKHSEVIQDTACQLDMASKIKHYIEDELKEKIDTLALKYGPEIANDYKSFLDIKSEILKFQFTLIKFNIFQLSS
ncbi:MAG: hypothetical protein ABIA04_07705 [Pseudomonadota bacterium]